MRRSRSIAYQKTIPKLSCLHYIHHPQLGGDEQDNQSAQHNGFCWYFASASDHEFVPVSLKARYMRKGELQ